MDLDQAKTYHFTKNFICGLHLEEGGDVRADAHLDFVLDLVGEERLGEGGHGLGNSKLNLQHKLPRLLELKEHGLNRLSKNLICFEQDSTELSGLGESLLHNGRQVGKGIVLESCGCLEVKDS